VGQATSSSSSSSSVSLLGIAGLRVLAAFEFVDERHVFVETVRDHDGCRECGQRAVSGGRHVSQVRDLPVGAMATRLVWHKREWRCRDCGRSWRETHPGIAARAVLTERARAEAARQVGELGRPVAAVAREFGVGWETVMRTVKDTAARLFADQQLNTRQRRPCVRSGSTKRS
jgi:transposase